MPTLIERLQRTIRRSRLIPAGSRLVAAVSGGSDSVALVRLLGSVQHRLGFRLAGLAHVNHQLRADASDADEAFCRNLAAELALPAAVYRVDVAGTPGASPEDRARRARYDALSDARARLGADLVALGHTRDDQAETVLLKLLRGAGTRGAAGIHPQIGCFVRPLLDLDRKSLREWLRDEGHAWVEDASNDDLGFTRNRMRHLVLHALEDAWGRPVAPMLARHAALARADSDLLEALTDTAAARVLRTDTEGIEVAIDALHAEPLAIQRRLLFRALTLAGCPEPSFEDEEAVRELAGGAGTSLQMAAAIVSRRNPESGVLSIRRSHDPEAAPPFCYALPIPGRVVVAEAGAALTADLVGPPGDIAELKAQSLAPVRAFLNAAAVGRQVRVRSWKPGDALRPLGLGGRKKVQDVFVDNKVPRDARHRLPLVTDERDQVIWVPGLALHADVGVTTDTKAVVVLKLTQVQVGGPE